MRMLVIVVMLSLLMASVIGALGCYVEEALTPSPVGTTTPPPSLATPPTTSPPPTPSLAPPVVPSPTLTFTPRPSQTITSTPWATPSTAGLSVFSEYGFAFQYSETFQASETGWFEDEANDRTGMVSVGMQNEETEYFLVMWAKPPKYSLDDGLADGFAVLGLNEGIAGIERGELVETTKAGHPMLYQYYAYSTATGEEVHGIVSAFYCDDSQRGFNLLTANSMISDKQDVLEDFVKYLDSFVCHGL